MTFRCNTCHAVVLVQAVERGSRPVSVACRSCGQHYQLDALDRSGRACQRLSTKARQLARDNQVDLIGAYSVALGIMTLEELREVGHSGSTACHTRGESQSTTHSRKDRFDPAFRPAVDAGWLPPREALERGNRDVFATRLAGRHRLPMTAAYAVADNRLSLLETLRKHATQRKQPRVAVRLKGSHPHKLAMTMFPAAALLILMAGLGWYVVRTPYPNEPAITPSRLPRSVEVQTDDSGAVLKVVGPSAQLVLVGFCGSGSGTKCEPVEIAIAKSRQADVRLGLFRYPTERETLYAINIQRRGAQRWVLGNGEEPIRPTLSPDLPFGTPTIPVTSQ